MKRSIKYAAVAIVCSLVSCFLEEFVGAMCMLGWLVAPIFGILAIVNCFTKDQSKILEYSIVWIGLYVVMGGIIMVFYNMWVISKM